ncbi:sugar phosphate isomerase/epimerase family protein [Micromonospora sp. LZ34]
MLAALTVPLTLLPVGTAQAAPDTDLDAATGCVAGYSTDVPVWFGPDADSGVANYDTGQGCTVLDLIWHGAPFANHGSFVSEVSAVAEDLTNDGILTAEERSSIVSAAARSMIGHEQKVRGSREVDQSKIGLVGYTVRATMPSAPEATLGALANCGYQNIEPSGSVGNFYGTTAAQLAPLVRGAGLQAPSLGVSLSNLENNLAGVIADANAMGAKYVRISGSGSWTIERYAQVADILNRVGAQLKAEGITVAYHNHGFEFELQNGVRGYDVLVRETNPNLVAMELDVYWASSVGVDPIGLFLRYPGRFPLLHLKDLAADGSFADVGEGTLDFARIFAHSELAGVDYAFTENDQPRPDGVSSACDSLAYLKALRY